MLIQLAEYKEAELWSRSAGVVPQNGELTAGRARAAPVP